MCEQSQADGHRAIQLREQYRRAPPGYIDYQNNPIFTPDLDMGPGWGWAALSLPFLEQQPLYNAINFSLGTTHASNSTAAVTTLAVFQCPSDGYNPQPCILYDSTFSNPIATVGTPTTPLPVAGRNAL